MKTYKTILPQHLIRKIQNAFLAVLGGVLLWLFISSGGEGADRKAEADPARAAKIEAIKSQIAEAQHAATLRESGDSDSVTTVLGRMNVDVQIVTIDGHKFAVAVNGRGIAICEVTHNSL